MTNDNVNHPAHYTNDEFSFRPCECIEIVRNLPFSLGCGIKYIWRAGKKGDTKKALEDIEKSKWFFADFFKNIFKEEHTKELGIVSMIEPKNRIAETKLTIIINALEHNTNLFKHIEDLKQLIVNK